VPGISGENNDKELMAKNVQTTRRSAMSIEVPVTNYWRAKKKQLEKKIESWSCLPEGVLKINVDAAYDADQGLGWYGSNS
jgi:hypothetical protein